MSDDHLHDTQVNVAGEQWEPISSAASVITLAALFKSCVGAFELLRCARTHEAEVKKLDLKLSIERCRILVWGGCMGLDPQQKSRDLLTNCPFHDAVWDKLQSLRRLLSNPQGLSSKYGCRPVKVTAQDARPLEPDTESPAAMLIAAVEKGKNGNAPYPKTKQVANITRWVIDDRKQFLLLINESSASVSGLQDITKSLVSRRHQELVLTSRMFDVDDPETQSMFREVCDSDHPALSNDISYREDVLTIDSAVQQDISLWIDGIESDQGSLKVIQNMENWSHGELRQNYLALIEDRGRQTPKLKTILCSDCGSRFLTRKEIQRHTESPSCPMCKRTFPCKDLFVQHICFRLQPDYFQRKTLKPDTTYRRTGSSRPRIIQNIPGPPFRCPRCYSSFDAEYEWLVHTSEEWNHCLTCGRRFLCPQNLIRHVATSLDH